jgi:hypothetical protein
MQEFEESRCLLTMPQALLTASEKGSPYRIISDSAVGVVFLGVPHTGSNKLLHRLGWAMATVYKLFGSRTDLLNLARGSPELDKLHDRFLSSHEAVDCICFYECVSEHIFGISIGPVLRPVFCFWALITVCPGCR